MLTLALVLAFGAQDLAITPGACRAAADRFAQMTPAVRERILKNPDLSTFDRGSLIAALDADIAQSEHVRRAYSGVTPGEADVALFAGMRPSVMVDYVKKCSDALHAAKLPPVAPGVCKAVALLDLQLLQAVRKDLEADAAASRKGKAHRYEDDQRGRMLAILDGDIARDRRILTRYGAVGGLSEADMKQATAMSREEQKLYLQACAV